MRGFGTDQDSIWGPDLDVLDKWYDANYYITACGAKDSRFYFIMTRGAKGYDGKKQVCSTRSSWAMAKKYISEQWKDGKIITGICYSTEKKEYLVVMTESSEGQNYGNYDSEWMDQEYKKGHYPTIIFHDPSDNKVLIVTTSDSNTYTIKTKHGLEK